jgi:leader peptidase (prepilin peptidase)/N-methyltransferase
VFVGLVLGWKLTLFSIFLSSLFGVVASFILFRKALANKEPIPFGPFIALGSFVSYLWGESLMNWYFNLLSF